MGPILGSGLTPFKLKSYRYFNKAYIRKKLQTDKFTQYSRLRSDSRGRADAKVFSLDSFAKKGAQKLEDGPYRAKTRRRREKMHAQPARLPTARAGLRPTARTTVLTAAVGGQAWAPLRPGRRSVSALLRRLLGPLRAPRSQDGAGSSSGGSCLTLEGASAAGCAGLAGCSAAPAIRSCLSLYSLLGLLRQ